MEQNESLEIAIKLAEIQEFLIDKNLFDEFLQWRKNKNEKIYSIPD